MASVPGFVPKLERHAAASAAFYAQYVAARR